MIGRVRTGGSNGHPSAPAPEPTTARVTARQAEALLMMQRLWAGNWPTIRQLTDALGITSTNATQLRVRQLVAKGLLTDIARPDFGPHRVRIYTHTAPGAWRPWLVTGRVRRAPSKTLLEVEQVAPDAATAIAWAVLRHDWPPLSEFTAVVSEGVMAAANHAPSPLRWRVMLTDTSGLRYEVTQDALTASGAASLAADALSAMDLEPQRHLTTVVLAPTQPGLGEDAP